MRPRVAAAPRPVSEPSSESPSERPIEMAAPRPAARPMRSLSSATVYETLDLLAELGLVRRVKTPRGAATYDSRVADHHHVVCGECGRIEDLDAAVDTGAAENAARAAGFAPDFAQLTV